MIGLFSVLTLQLWLYQRPCKKSTVLLVLMLGASMITNLIGTCLSSCPGGSQIHRTVYLPVRAGLRPIFVGSSRRLPLSTSPSADTPRACLSTFSCSNSDPPSGTMCGYPGSADGCTYSVGLPVNFGAFEKGRAYAL